MCLRKTISGKYHYYRDTSMFEKSPFPKYFQSTQKEIAGVFKFLRFEEWTNKCERSTSFPGTFKGKALGTRLVNGRPNSRYKAEFSNFFWCSVIYKLISIRRYLWGRRHCIEFIANFKGHNASPKIYKNLYKMQQQKWLMFLRKKRILN